MRTYKPTQLSLQEPPVNSQVKYLMLGLLELDGNPAFDSEISAWIDTDGYLQIYAFIYAEEESWIEQFFGLINTVEFAPLISSLEIKGPDIGVNGTRLYDLEPLLKDESIVFSVLKEFEIEQTSILHQNITLISYNDYYSDNGAGGKILDKMPLLEVLTLPSAPNISFFERTSHPLQYLSLQAGMEHQQFVQNLAKTTCFPHLKHFEWTDGPGFPRFTSSVPSRYIHELKNAPQYNFETFEINKYFSAWRNSKRFL